jgi:hypothetical protein
MRAAVRTAMEAAVQAVVQAAVRRAMMVATAVMMKKLANNAVVKVEGVKAAAWEVVKAVVYEVVATAQKRWRPPLPLKRLPLSAGTADQQPAQLWTPPKATTKESKTY